MKYKAERDIPEFARSIKSLSPTKLAAEILNKRNKQVTPDSVRMWLKRHADVEEQLSKEMISELPTTKQEISGHIFQNGVFQELRSVKQWLIVLSNRKLSKEFIKNKLYLLKNVCRGKIFGHDLVAEGKWAVKHPDRLTYQDVLEIVHIGETLGADTYYVKRDMKDFLENVRDVQVGRKITVGKPSGFGKYKFLYVESDVLDKILEKIKEVSYEAYVVDRFMFVTGTRITATLNANIEDIKGDIITVFDKGRFSKYPRGHPWEKYLTKRLQREMQPLISERKVGKIFQIKYQEISEINKLVKEVLKAEVPEILQLYPDLNVNHFWRHMFFQHDLRRNNWNFAAAGALGGSTPQSVAESYGGADKAQVEKWAKEYIDVESEA